MTYKRHRIVIDYVNLLMQFIIAYLTMTMVLYPFDSQSLLHTLVLLPAPYVSYWIRKYTRHIWSFTLLHLILAAIYLLPERNLYYVIVNASYLFVLTAFSYYMKHKLQDRTITSPFLLMYIILIYISSHLLDFRSLMPLCFWLAILYALLFLLNSYLLNLDRFVRNHEHIVNVPFRQIKNVNYILITFLCCLVLLSMLCFSRLPLGNLLTILGTLMIKALKLFLTWLFKRRQEDVEWTEEEPLPSMERLHHAESSRLMEILSAIFQWIFTIVFIIGAVALILYLIYRIYQHFYLKGEGVIKDEVHFLSPFEKKEKLKQKPKPFQPNFHLLGKSNNITIRRHFAKAVLANAGSNLKPLESLTPSQLSEYVVGQNQEYSSEENDRILVTNCYEKARYSNQICSREEVQLIKRIVKKKSYKKMPPGIKILPTK